MATANIWKALSSLSHFTDMETETQRHGSQAQRNKSRTKSKQNFYAWKSAKLGLKDIWVLHRLAAQTFILSKSLQSQHKIMNFWVPAPLFLLQREDAACFYLHWFDLYSCRGKAQWWESKWYILFTEDTNEATESKCAVPWKAPYACLTLPYFWG